MISKRIKELRNKFFVNKKFKVGISWKSLNEKCQYRNIDLTQMLPILSNPHCDFINLQFGKFDKDLEKLKSLPGIGEYTSRSILAIAHNQPYIPMDGNVERILKRVFLLKTKNEISKEKIIELEIPTGNPLIIEFDNQLKIQKYYYQLSHLKKN